MSDSRPFALVTGASTGIGFELAKRAPSMTFAADEPEIEPAAASLSDGGTGVEALQAHLATTEGVDKLYAAVCLT